MQVTSFQPALSLLKAMNLRPLKMERLGMIVALAGPNGAGKSRVLQLLRQHCEPSANRLKAHHEARDGIRMQNTLIEQSEAQPPDSLDRLKLPQRQARKLAYEQTLEKFSAITTNPPNADRILVVNYVPKVLGIGDPGDLSPHNLKTKHSAAKNPGVDSLHDSAGAYIQHAQNRWREVTHQNYAGNVDEAVSVKKEYADLSQLIASFLKTPLDRNSEGEATVFGMPLARAALSDGQLVLVQLAVALHAQKAREGLILLLDEPENHLHPGALIDVIEGIRRALPATQIWISTHSVPLLAYLYSEDSQCIWYVKEGSLAFAGKKTEEVVMGLLGGEMQRERLLQFLELPHQLASSNFTSQCLVSPLTVPLKADDPQVRQVMATLWKATGGRTLRLLDVGAGKGRLLGGLHELDAAIGQQLDYVAYDVSDTDKAACEAQLREVYGMSEDKWFSSEDGLFASKDKNSFDVVVMCNVLHEIAPDHWPTIFGPSGLIQRALAKNGYVLIVEDLRIPVGELPNERGFFLLDTSHLRTLFGITNDDVGKQKFLTDDARGDGRLKAHLISVDLIDRLSATSRNAALLELGESAKRNLRAIRSSSSKDFDSGQQYGFWSQQLTNCLLYLEQVS